jgi:inosine-uridine nucleoside N-ribohydrolase
MKQKIILDCDPGHDDAVALLLAARHYGNQQTGMSWEEKEAYLQKAATIVCTEDNTTSFVP